MICKGKRKCLMISLHFHTQGISSAPNGLPVPWPLLWGEGPVVSALVVPVVSIPMAPVASALVDEVALRHLAAHCVFQPPCCVCAGVWGLCDSVSLFVKPG